MYKIVIYNKKQSDLLKLSIDKWFNIAYHGGVDTAFFNCALCLVYTDCIGCPVFMYTKRKFCFDTPYEDDWLIKVKGQSCPYKVTDISSLNAAKKELNFLTMLFHKTVLFRNFKL